jgi:hypothetical protein
MKEVNFNPAGMPLWVKMEMKGIYAISYVYQLLDSDGETPLTSPLVLGDNINLDDDQHAIKNCLNPGEPLSNYHDRVVSTSFLVTKVDEDYGFKLKVAIYQGPTVDGCELIGALEETGKVGNEGIIRKTLKIKLKSQP